MKQVRAYLLISGRVQGVCYRMDARRAALDRNLTGWVRNLSDGRVEAILEGEESEVRSMVQWCHTGPPLARVSKVDVEWMPYTGEYDSLEIRFM